jgi:hypothetical protein
MKNIYLSILVVFCASLSLSAQIRSTTIFSDTTNFNVSHAGHRSGQVYEQFSEQTPTTASFINAPFSSFSPFGDTTGDGWLVIPGGDVGNAQKVPVGNGLGMLMLIVLSYAASVFVKARRDKALKN